MENTDGDRLRARHLVRSLSAYKYLRLSSHLVSSTVSSSGIAPGCWILHPRAQKMKREREKTQVIVKSYGGERFRVPCRCWRRPTARGTDGGTSASSAVYTASPRPPCIPSPFRGSAQARRLSFEMSFSLSLSRVSEWTVARARGELSRVSHFSNTGHARVRPPPSEVLRMVDTSDEEERLPFFTKYEIRCWLRGERGDVRLQNATRDCRWISFCCAVLPNDDKC